MVDRVAADPAFGLTKEEIVAGLVPENFVGRAPILTPTLMRCGAREFERLRPNFERLLP